MVKARLYAGLAVTVCTVLCLAALGWCQQSDGQQSGGGDAAGGQSGGNFEMSGGGGSGSSGPTDQNGGSPGVSLANLGFQPSFTYLFRGRYSPSAMGYDVRLTGDLVRASYSGGSENYQGPLHTSFPQGASLTGKMDVTLLQASADLGLGTHSYGGVGFKIGPRLQWTMYSDQFKATAEFAGTSVDIGGANGCSMYGIGLAGSIDVSHFTSASVIPKVQFSLAVGGGKSMRYKEWELSVDLVRTSLDEYAYGRNVKAGASVGLMGKYFDETTASGAVAGVAAEENLHFSLFVPFGRAFLTF